MNGYIPSTQDRQVILARLNGYLDAISSIDGWFRDHFINCTLVEKNGRDLRFTISDCIREKLNDAIVEIQPLQDGLTSFLKGELLKSPFAQPSNQSGQAFKYTKHELIYQICDMVSLMAEDFHSQGKWNIQINTQSDNSYCGVAVEYKDDVLIIFSRRGDSGYRKCVADRDAKNNLQNSIFDKLTSPCLKVENLSCTRDYRELFSGLSFTVNAGEILLLEGNNGSGKTSLLRILCGFREADEGEISWCGELAPSSQYYSDMAYVGHADGIKKELTVLENLKLHLALGASGRMTISEALAKVKLGGYEDTLVQALSAGQKRRLSLARLLVTHNVLWILDEPFTSLDKLGISLTESLMLGHCAQAGMIVMTSHHDVNLPGVTIQRIRLGG